VFLGYASSKGYTLLDRRLYLPERWFSVDYQEKREECKIPEDVVFKSKTELALEMVVEQAQLGVLPYRWLCFDEFFGHDSAFMEKVGHYGSYLAEVPCDTRVYLSPPQLGVPEHRGRGRKPTKARVLAGEAEKVADLARALPPESLQRLTLKEGSKGPIVAELACLNVFVVRQGEGKVLEVREQSLARQGCSGVTWSVASSSTT
jgi:SRSO17 transposase